MSFTDAKPSDPKEQLLNDISSSAINQRHAPSLPLRPFAALMIKVADETADTVADLKAHITRLNEQNAKLQWWVVALAVAALIGTFVQTVVAILPLISTSKADRAVSSPVAQSPSAQRPEPAASVASPPIVTAPSARSTK